MLILRANLDDLEVVTATGTDIEVNVSAVTANSASPPVVDSIPDLGPLASITTATTTKIVDTAAITNNYNVNVKHINIRNNHATTTETVTVQVADGTNTVSLIKATLLAGEALVFTQGGVWLHYDVNGAIYPSVGNAASQAEMEAAAASDKYVTPQGVKWHPGVCKCWGFTTGAGTPVLATPSHNMTSITDTNTGRLTVTIGTDFSDANYVVVFGGTTTNSTTAVKILAVNTKAAGSFEIDSYSAVTPTLSDIVVGFDWACFGDQA